ncbi:hypothetical protein K8I85_11085 [bacterium]|nr:hypothetical protein [bacterium]
MRKFLAGLSSILWLLPFAGVALAAGGAEKPSLEAELAEIMNEILESAESGSDPFADGAVPDLVVLSSANIAGEVAPCG